MTKLYRIINEKLENVRKYIDNLYKTINEPKTKEGDKIKNTETIKNLKKKSKILSKDKNAY